VEAAMIAFTIALTQNDWDVTRRGWRCPVLKIPGAKVDGLYAGAQLDESWYKADGVHEIVRWARSETPPATAALAVKLPEDWTPRESKDFWKKLAIVVPIVTALITTSGTYLAAKKANPQTDASYESWTVTGRAMLRDRPAQNERPLVHAIVKPPQIWINEHGNFDAKIPVLNNNGDRNFPAVTFMAYEPGYQPDTVELDPGKPAFNSGAYRLNIQHEKRRIDIGGDVILSPLPKNAYSSPAASSPYTDSPTR
jgi:hypothetical protein